MEARGFSSTWRSWVSRILTTGKTDVLLNGVPSRWINCKRGLRQGDPISPYLFILVADVLHKLVRRAAAYGDAELQHPLVPGMPCPILQYADDTLILIKGGVDVVSALKTVLDDFSHATGLTINYHKSTFVPLHIDPDAAVHMANTLGCQISEFPQTYLGLPLSPLRLRVRDFQPLIAKFDKFLFGWKARLLSTRGRLVLVNVVLSNLAVYFMSSILVPKTVLEELNRRRRSFLWTDEEVCHGSQCLISWEHVCQAKEYDGLGVRSLADQNHSLLLKFLHKLHDPELLPWKTWFLNHASGALSGHQGDSYIGRIIQEELPLYRALTIVVVGDGRTTSFWSDRWMLNTTLAETYPALFSHCILPHCSVHDALNSSLRSHFKERLTAVAAEELHILNACLASVCLTGAPDTRRMFYRPNKLFDTRLVPHAMQTTCSRTLIPIGFGTLDSRPKSSSSHGSCTMAG